MSDLPSKNISPFCSLCKQDFDIYYRTPRVVPKCGHTYCQRCISNHISVKASRKVFICPQCSSQVVIRKGVQEDVPKNIGIIDVVKNLKKYSTNQKQQQRKSNTLLCSQHQRPLQLVCQSCSFKKICSHCILFGQHHSHNYRKQAPATNLNLKEVKQVYQLLSNSVKLVLLPDSQNNLKRTVKEKISQGLKKNVRNNFKQYYDILQKRQSQLLQQCDNIIINEGGIDKNIDKLVVEYDTLKNKYQIDWSFAIEHSHFTKLNQVITINSLQEFIGRCQDLHTKVISIEDQAFKHIELILKNIGVRISQALLFKIQQMPFSLKRLVQTINSEQGQKQITSPDRRARLKSTNAQAKTKSVIEKDQGRINTHSQLNQRSSNKSQSKSVIPKKNKNNYSQIDKQELLQDDFSLLEPGKSDLRNAKQQTKNQKQLKQLISNKCQRGSLPPKASKSKNITEYDSKTMHMRQPKEQDKPKNVMKQLSPAKTVNVFKNQPISVVTPNQNSQQLKFIRPTKQISFQLLSKFQQIMVQTDRQLQQNTLQLVNLDINDTLLLYLLDYLRVKKHRFQVIKLVKNAITDEGFRTILAYLVNDNTTQLLNLTTNQLTFKSLELILLFAQKNSILKTIYLGGNKINGMHIKSKKNQISKYELQIII